MFQSDSDKILVFLPEESRWHDIEVKTILSMEKIEKHNT